MWYFNWTVIDKKTISRIESPRYNELVLQDLDSRNEGVYRCLGTTEDGLEFMAKMTLNVISKC